MKLKKLLLPIASVASVAAVVAPIVTSCGSGSFDGSKIYIPKIRPVLMAEGKTGYNNTEGNKLYFDELDENPEIFAQDMKYAISTQLYDLKHSYDEAEHRNTGKYEASIKYSNIKVDKTNFKLSYDLNGSLNMKSASGDVFIELPKVYFSLKNIPYKCEIVRDGSSSVVQYAWMVEPNMDFETFDDVEITLRVKGLINSNPSSRYSEVYSFLNKEITVNKDNYDKLSVADTNEYLYAIDLFENYVSRTRPFSYHMSLIYYQAE